MQTRLSYKLILYIVLISITITSIALYYNLQKTYDQQLTQFETELNDIQNNRLDLLSQSLWDVNSVAINIFLKNLLQEKHIIYAKIVENDGNVYEKGILKRASIVKKEFKINKEFNNESYYIGTLTVIADLTPIHEELQDRVINTIITELLEILFIALIIIFLIKKFLTNPLEIMANYAKNLNLNNLDKALILNTHKTKHESNEIDIVANSINAMRQNLLDELEKSREKDTVLAHQSKMAAMGEMIGNIAHQWRQPLSVISTASTGIKMQKELGVLNEEELTKTMDAINESTQYLSTTIDDFRNFFKPEKEKKEFRIISIFNKTFSLISQQFKNKDIEIIQNIDESEVLGFENELIQVIINLLNNARDELVMMQNQRRLVFIDSHSKNGSVKISIKDNAGGIPDNIREKVFEPYFTTKEKNIGTGIGLYMSEEIIVKHMQGTITVNNVSYEYENETYDGAEFIINIPTNH